MTDKKISILLPTVNRPFFLEKALASIANQTIAGSILEIIVSENGGNKESKNICEKFSNLPVKYYFQDNQLPPVQHIKKVFNLSSGEILAFLGDDDWWAPEHLETAFTSLCKHKNAVAAFSRAAFVIDEKIMNNLTMPNLSFTVIPFNSFSSNEFVYGHQDIVSCCWLFTPFHFSTLVGKRETLLPAINTLYADVEFYNSDRELYPMLAQKGDIIFNESPDTFVRWYAGNSTNIVKQNQLDESFNKGSRRILQNINSDVNELSEVWRYYLAGVNDEKILKDVKTKLDRITLNNTVTGKELTGTKKEIQFVHQQIANTPDFNSFKDNISLAVFTPFLGALSETFIQKHISLLAPNKTVIVTGNIQNNSGNLPVLQIPWTEGAYKYSPQMESLVLEFLSKHKVTHLLVEYGCQGTEIVELNVRKLKLPIFIHFHGYDASQMLRRSDIVEYYKWMSTNVTGVIACSNDMAKRLVKAGLKKESLIVNHYGINIPVEKSINTDSEACRFVFVGRLVEKKAPMLLLEAFLLASKKAGKITLDIIGDEGIYGQKSKLFPQMQNFIKENNLENIVKLHGAQNQDYISDILKSSSVYVQHSITVPETGDQEGLPNSILEAASFGLPVVSTIHSGISEEVEDGITGFLTAENDTVAMAEKMIYLANNPGLRKQMGDSARKKIEKEFSTELSINNLRQIIFKSEKSVNTFKSTKQSVSVIIPTYNREKSIEQAIKSIQSQTVPVSEIIIVDDASTDNTSELIALLQNADPKIKYLKLQNNSGAQVARNTGIKNAASDWVSFLDSDDTWLPGRVEYALKAAEAGKADVVYSNYIRREPDGTEVLVNPPERNNFVYNELLKGSFVTFPGLFVKRNCFVETGFLDESIKSWQEWDTALRLSKQYRFAYDDNPGFIWIWHDGDTISKDNKRELIGYLQIVLKYKDDILSVCGAGNLMYHINNILRKISVLQQSDDLIYLKNQVMTLKQKLEESSGVLAG